MGRSPLAAQRRSRSSGRVRSHEGGDGVEVASPEPWWRAHYHAPLLLDGGAGGGRRRGGLQFVIEKGDGLGFAV